MNFPKNILVVISGKKKKHEALNRALKFMAFSDVNIHIFNVIYEPVMEFPGLFSNELREELKKEYIADRYSYLNEIAEQLVKKGIKCNVQVVWHSETRIAIENAATELKPDLVIKRISAKSTSINPFAMPIDRHLLRYCPAPLLLVRDAEWCKGPILAAIDPFAKDTPHIKLNGSILKCSKMLSLVTSNPVFVVASHIVPTLSPAIGVAGVDYDSIRNSTKKACEERLETLLKSHYVPRQDMHVIEGQEEQAIPRFVEEVSASLVILGTVGRTGLAAAFIGNTAEHVLAELNCDVLALKPV